MIPDDPSFYEIKGDPFPYGRKKDAQAGKVTKAYLAKRQSDYAKYGLGSPLSMSLASGHTEDEKLKSYKIVTPRATKKGMVYTPSKGAVPLKAVIKINHAKEFETLREALEYVNGIAGDVINPKSYKISGKKLECKYEARHGALANKQIQIRIKYSENRSVGHKYRAQLSY